MPLGDNEKINFKNCLDSVTDNILKLLIYGSDSKEVINSIVKYIQIIRRNTVKCMPDRHFERTAVRTFNKWYFYGYIKRGNTKKYLDNG